MKRINFTTAKLAKEAGFNIDTKYQNYYIENAFYDEVGDYFECDETSGSLCLFENKYAAPYQAELQEWLREEHGLHVYTDMTTISNLPERLGKRNWYCCIQPFSTNNEIKVENNGKYFFDTYEEALEEGLVQGLKIVIDAKDNHRR